mmetsp:Transcript_38031/g.69287  ORF Transcript_38031/g.69287 Transcript_38031/m.69287 type:complete len:206 (-) Transcript_38031:1157-1774(-)
MGPWPLLFVPSFVLGAHVTPGLVGADLDTIRGGHEEQRPPLLVPSSTSMKVRFTVMPKPLSAAWHFLEGAAISADPTAMVAMSCPGMPPHGATNTSCRSGCWRVSATRLCTDAPSPCCCTGSTLLTGTGSIFRTMSLSEPARKSAAGTWLDAGRSSKGLWGCVGWSAVRVTDVPSANFTATHAASPTMVSQASTSTNLGARLKLS